MYKTVAKDAETKPKLLITLPHKTILLNQENINLQALHIIKHRTYCNYHQIQTEKTILWTTLIKKKR